MRVLIADRDNAFLSNLKTDSHRHQNVECHTVSDGLQCLKSLHEFRPDILVLQHSLLWGGAGGVLEVMQDNSELARVPVLISMDDAGDACHQYTNLNVIAQIQKPFRFTDVLNGFKNLAIKIGA